MPQEHSVLRYLGLTTVVVLALALTIAVGVMLWSGLAERITAVQPLRLTVFDGVAAVGGIPPHLRAMLEDADSGRPAGDAELVVRFEDGWCRWAWASGQGAVSLSGPRGLGRGPHAFTISFPETGSRPDVCGSGTVWVWPAEAPVVWLDAAAIVPPDLPPAGAAGPPAGPGQEVIEVIKTLATGRQPVYLVASDAEHYAWVRRRLREVGAPPGPAFVIRPGDEASRLTALKQLWPRVEAAVVCAPAVEEAAKRSKVDCGRVPCAGGRPGDAAAINAWRGVLERLALPRTP